MNKGLYRGKIKDQQTGHYELDWAFGNRVDELSTGKVFICDLSHFNDKTLLKDVLIEVDPETVGQFTGLTDKNGKKIFEGDFIQPPHNKRLICLIKSGNYKPCALERFNDSSESDLPEATGFYAETKNGDQYFIGRKMVVKIVGNIIDNPELLSEKVATV